MSEVNQNTELEEETTDLNEQVEEEVDDSPIITVPIDESLTHHGEAADAKAVGDALSQKADASQIVDITVDGQSKDASGNITVKAEHVPYSGEQTVKQKLDAVDAKTSYDIPKTTGVNPQSIGEAIDSLEARTAETIFIDDEGQTTIADHISDLEDDMEDAQTELTELTDEEVHTIVAEAFEDDEDEGGGT